MSTGNWTNNLKYIKKQQEEQRCGLINIPLNSNLTAKQVEDFLKEPTNPSIAAPQIVINASNASMMTIPYSSAHRERAVMFKKTDCWHKFEVLSPFAAETDQILLCVMKAVHPFEVFPIKVHNDGQKVTFLASNCGAAIESLCRKGMVILSTGTLGFDLTVQITLGFCTDILFNVQAHFTKIIQKRYNRLSRYLDLANFHKDPDFVNACYCPLSYNLILHSVLLVIKTTLKDVVSINFANNQISSLKEFVSLLQLRSLYKLDFSQNLINNVTEIRFLRPLQLKELLLDQNPLCEKYQDEQSYIIDVQRILQTLQKLDGVMISQLGLRRAKKNFILSPDGVSLADQFLEYYFTLFDSGNRRNLKGLYHEKALFSLCATCIPGQTSTSTSRLTQYTVQSRNLIMLSDYSKNVTKLRQGSQQVVEAICQLPRTEHDPYSFKVDLLECNPGVVISVSGVFKELTKTDDYQIRSFYRVFVLVKTGPKSYQIANETMHISNATTVQIVEAFRYPKPPPKIAADINETDFKKERKIEFMSDLTMMNKKWSRKCLEETNWDFKQALSIFTELYKVSKIPEEAFAKECTT